MKNERTARLNNHPMLNTVTKGDCLKLLPKLPSESVDIVSDDAGEAVRPLAVFIQGSGCDSVFVRAGQSAHVSGRYQNVLRGAGKGRVRVMAVEEPGVEYLGASKQPGSPIGCSQPFLEQHTLPQWADAINAAIRGALTLRGIDPARVLVAGHSEGGIVAARVAADNPQVTHVAVLSGGGPTQLFDLAETKRDAYEGWAEVRKDPDSATKFWLGHPNRRWSSFLASSPAEELLRTKAPIFVAQGTRDPVVPLADLQFLHATLAARGKDVVIDRVEGGDHGFSRAGQSSPLGMMEVLGRVVDWFLDQR
jgi:predicted esterase